ncbi:rRNA maturation RNase YbeY [Candidatus Peregrinibacteria bacterium]|nr:rRNA maturation RNase YbeY [Candidatus Peregrinibacteria bacterium]
MLNLEYYNETGHPVSAVIFEELLDVINQKIPQKNKALITLTLVNKKLIRQINKKYRKTDAPTDVISLSYLNTDYPGQNILGEIFICVDIAERQAKEHGHDLRTELKFLFVHGVLHCIGYEHATEEDFETMMMLTNRILKSA